MHRGASGCVFVTERARLKSILHMWVSYSYSLCMALCVYKYMQNRMINFWFWHKALFIF